MPQPTPDAARRQREILDAATKLFAERGYANTSVQAIIDAVGIAKGTFYHHFPTKEALLDPLIRRLIDNAVELAGPVVDAPGLDAIEKFTRFHQKIGEWKASRRGLMLDLAQAMHHDANALLLKRSTRATLEAVSPLLTEIILQGVEEGVFDTCAPSQAARLVHQLGQALGLSLHEAMSAQPASLAQLRLICDAHEEAIERVLGAAPGTLQLVDRGALSLWLQAAQGDE